jgi:hypothetical protein
MFEESYHLRGWSKDVLNLFIAVFQSPTIQGLLL